MGRVCDSLLFYLCSNKHFPRCLKTDRCLAHPQHVVHIGKKALATLGYKKHVSVSQGFPGGSAGYESARNAGDLGAIPGLGRSPGKGNGYPLQYSGLENSMVCIVQGVTKSQTRLSDFHFSFHQSPR